MIPRLRIAAEMTVSPGWVPVVPDNDCCAAYQADVVLWIPPQPDSSDFARRVVEALNNLPALSSHQRNMGE